jgi:asparagine synthase (glutamine-hydrolysing)
MRHRYLVLLDRTLEGGRPEDEALPHKLHTLGMLARWCSGAACIYASADTAIIDLPRPGVIIGDLYFRDGLKIQHGRQLPDLPSSAAVRKFILSNCWGEYLLVQPVPGDSQSLEVTRSPSHACELPCMYSASDIRPFLTSDITLAFDAGLHRRQVDFQNLAHRLIYPEIKLSSTALKGISELLPGHSLSLSQGRSSLDGNWDPWAFVRPEMRYQSLDEATKAVRDSVHTVINSLANHDRAVLVELSGGLDSSIVAACLGSSDADVHCATMMSSLPGADERDYASAVVDPLGFQLLESELKVEDAAFDIELPPQMANPAVGPLQYGLDRLMQASATRAGVHSAFCGAGGDTVFGYLTSAAPAADAFRAAGIRTGVQAIHDLATFHQCTYWKAGRLAFRKLLRGTPTITMDHFLVHPDLRTPPLQLHPWMHRPTNTLPGDCQRIYELAGTQVFQGSCLRSLTRPLRMPLLSQPVMEACLRVSSWMWFARGENRAVARRAFADLLPEKVLARRSKGTLTAYLGAVHRRRKREITQFLVDGQLQANGLLDADALLRLEAQDHVKDERTFMRLFHLCILENWVRQQDRYV